MHWGGCVVGVQTAASFAGRALLQIMGKPAAVTCHPVGGCVHFSAPYMGVLTRENACEFSLCVYLVAYFGS